MIIKPEISAAVLSCVNELGKPKEVQFTAKDVVLNLTPADFKGDYTIVLFPFVKKLGLQPDVLAAEVDKALQAALPHYNTYNMVKGFMNLELQEEYWIKLLTHIAAEEDFGTHPVGSNKEAILIEYPSPNTNKPLHLGHLRNIFLGSSLGNILEANGHKVYRTCLYNDRGTNISKSMWAYQHANEQKTPENTGLKGDHLVGDYYVEFSDAYKKELSLLQENGLTEDEAKKQSQLNREINELTIKWEQGDAEVMALWKKMNGWFYEGVKKTYQKLNLSFDKEYYESEVYDKGRETVKDGLEKGVFYQQKDTSVWIDLTDIDLDKKLVLRSNGTTVYITQDMALAYQKQKDFDFQRSVYVVGNEQDYHFKVLFEILKRLGLKASEHLHHLSYGMVELPTGKMKSREGTVVDADDLLDEVVKIAREKADEQGKLAEVSDADKEHIYTEIGTGALRYYLLRVDPVKKMVFNPAESIDFNGNTAPFIQYIYARTQSLLRNAKAQEVLLAPMEAVLENYTPHVIETSLVRSLAEFPEVIKEAGKNYSPALVANYVYQVASGFSTFYHDLKVLKEEDIHARSFRLHLSEAVGKTIKKALHLLCIGAPERM